MWESFLTSIQTVIPILASLGVFKFLETFIPFLITRKDKKAEKKEEKEDRIKDLEERLENGLIERSNEGKQRFDTHTMEIKKQMQISEERYNEVKEVLLRHAKDNEERDLYMHTMGEALMGIIHDRVLHNVDEYIERGGITREELTTLTSMYAPYRKLGGNGDVQAAYNIADELPIITKDEAVKRDKALKRAAL